MAARSEESAPVAWSGLRTQQSAAIAGILFAVLAGASMVLIQVSVPDDRIYDSTWVQEQAGELGIAVGLMPFAAISFLWFVGVIRDQLGEREDRFFATVFLGSGIVFLSLWLVWSMILGATLVTAEADPSWPGSSGFTFTVSVANVSGSVAMLRMAGVFVFSAGTMWLRTAALPRWVVWLSYVVGVVLLAGGESLRPLRLAFPLWVLVVSVRLLWPVITRKGPAST